MRCSTGELTELESLSRRRGRVVRSKRARNRAACPARFWFLASVVALRQVGAIIGAGHGEDAGAKEIEEETGAKEIDQEDRDISPMRVMEGVTIAVVKAPGGVRIGFSGP
jgi:hypothetical protein